MGARQGLDHLANFPGTDSLHEHLFNGAIQFIATTMIALEQLRLKATTCARNRQISNLTHRRFQMARVMSIALVTTKLCMLIGLGMGQSEALKAPEDVVEQETIIAELLETAAIGVLTMSPCQMEAMICCLKETVEDISQLVMIFRKYGIEIEEVQWPADKDARVRLKASVSPVRKKMRSVLLEWDCA
jgi:hypothetical protein